MKNTRGFAAAKAAGFVVAATAASLMATAGPAYAATGFSPVPARHHHHHHHNGDGGNTFQSPTQVCGNNVGSNIVFGVGSKNQKAKSSNSGNCKQKTSSR
jgi:hypothetical protein